MAIIKISDETWGVMTLGVRYSQVQLYSMILLVIVDRAQSFSPPYCRLKSWISLAIFTDPFRELRGLL